MIHVLSLNPSLDKTASLPCLNPDAPNRIRVERQDLGGKGINVARALNALGCRVMLTGFDFPGGPVTKGLKEAGVRHQLIEIPGSLRVNLKLREEAAGRTVEINETGATVTGEALTAIRHALTAACRPGEWAVLSGSLPPGAPADTYARLCEQLTRQGCPVAADCDGEPLSKVIEAGPRLIKPNAQEFFALTGADPENEQAAEAACRGLMEKGVGMICLTLGGKGARLYTPGGAYFCPAAPVTPLGTQGAGDSLLAGLLTALSRGEKKKDALRFASAAAGASVMRSGTLLCRLQDVESLLKMAW